MMVLVISCFRADIIAQLYYARKLAKKLHPVAKLVNLPGGHLVSHERVEEVKTYESG